MSHLELTQLGKYQIVELVGEGAMGAVYRALDPVLNRIVAIKVMSDAVARDEELRARFLREAQSAGSLQHPNVITIFDFGEVEGHLYIAMEFVEGADLEYVLRQCVPLTLAQKLDIAIDLLSALAYAHRRGIVHRDIKPGNIRLTEEWRAKIMDFGIVHLESSRMTRTGIALGTPDYMAPEQITGGKVTAATDIFAAGGVLYELLTGSRPFPADTLHGVMYKIVTEDPPLLETMLPGLPRELSPIVARALSKEPDQRYPTALDMANELSAVRRTVEESPTSGPSTVSLRSSLDRALTAARLRAERQGLRVALYAAGGTAAVLVLVAGVWFTLAAHRTRSSRGAEGSPLPVASPGARGAQASVSQTGRATAGAAAPTIPRDTTTVPAVVAKDPAAQHDSLASARQRREFTDYTTTALRARQNAVDAGASAEQLAPGDSARRQADRLAANGKLDEAKGLFSYAATLWSNAAQRPHGVAGAAATTGTSAIARPPASPPPVAASPTSSASSTATRSASPPTQPQPDGRPLPGVTPQVTPSRSSAIAPPPVVSPPATAPAPTANTDAEIRAAVQGYARAIDSRDLAELRRANPGLTDDQQHAFDLFFHNVRSLHTSLAVLSSTVNGNAAEAQLSGTYDYQTADGQSHHQEERFVATLRRDGGVWKLTAVR